MTDHNQELVERVARAMKTWKFAKSPCLDGYRICGIVEDGDRTSFPWKVFKTVEEAQAALDELNARAAIAAAQPDGVVAWSALRRFQSQDGTWLQIGKEDFLAALASRPSPLVDTGEALREALEKCRAKFVEYVELHRAKLNEDTPTPEWFNIHRKVARNQEMVDLCDAALSAPEPVEEQK